MADTVDILNAAGFAGIKFSYSDTTLSSMRGPCPKCGGSRRLLIFVDHALPYWNYACDLCGYSGKSVNVGPELYGTSLIDPADRPDPTLAIEQLANSTAWQDYHNNLTAENREWLRGRGIPDAYQDQWGLGFLPSKAIMHQGEVFRSPAYTIPKFDHHGKLVNMDYRLVDPPNGVGKYRSEAGVPTAPFISSPGRTDQDMVFVVEGSFKAMVLHLFLNGNGWNAQVIGLPGVSSKLYADHVFDYPKAYVLLDPDSPDTTKRVSRETRAHPVYLPVKIDDAILGGMSWEAFMAVVENSEI